MFKEKMISDNGMTFKRGVVEELSTPSTDTKMKIRYEIESQVFDLHDSVADTTKWVSLLTTLMSRMYDTFTDTQKARLAPEDKALIEMVFDKFKEVNTRADVQFAEEGPAMIDKILERQAKIGLIVS